MPKIRGVAQTDTVEMSLLSYRVFPSAFSVAISRFTDFLGRGGGIFLRPPIKSVDLRLSADIDQ